MSNKYTNYSSNTGGPSNLNVDDDDIIGSYGGEDPVSAQAAGPSINQPIQPAPSASVPRSASNNNFTSLSRQPLSNTQPAQPNAQIAAGAYPPSEPMFVAEVRSIERMFQQLRDNQDTLRYLRERIKTVIATSEAAKVEDQINSRTAESRDIMEDCRKAIKHMFEKGKKAKTPEEQMRKNQQMQLAKQLYKIAQEFQAMQLNIKSDVLDKLKRQYKIVRPNATQAEADDYAGNASLYNSQSNNVFQQAALSGREQALSAFQEAKIQQNQLEKLNQAIEEMLNLFQEMQILIDVQGEQINDIQINSESVVVNMQDASKEMSKAIKYRISARKRAWCIFVLVLIALGVLAIIIYFTIPKNKS